MNDRSLLEQVLEAWRVNKASNSAPHGHNARRDRKSLAAAFRASGDAVETFLRERVPLGERISFFQGRPIRCYLTAHDSHHQIVLARKQSGLRLPEKVALARSGIPATAASSEARQGCGHPASPAGARGARFFARGVQALGAKRRSAKGLGFPLATSHLLLLALFFSGVLQTAPD